MKESTVFEGLEPAGLWRHFEAITKIPRPSHHEEKMAAYVEAWAAQHGFPFKKDVVGNVCVQVPGRADRAGAPPVVLQAHMDMVCERDSTSPHDAERGDIHTVRDGDWILGEGTTLGADNGIGVAAMMLAAEAPDARRGPLDLLFTVTEETGLIGALGLDPAIVRGRVLLNLDSEDEGELCVGCAGSSDATVTMRCPRTPVEAGWTALRVQVGGLLGGHSGVDIVKPRLNAIRALARVLLRAAGECELRLGDFRGGNKRNAIPREASAVIFIPAASEKKVRGAISREVEDLRKQYGDAEPGIDVQVQPAGRDTNAAWNAEGTRRLLDLVLALPCGVLAMSPAVVGLVETSNSIGIAATQGDEVRIDCMIRSSLNPAMGDVLNIMRSAARLAGAGMEGVAGYPGWQPNPNSRVLEVAKGSFRRVFGHEAKVVAVHAGLECGVIGERVPGMDMVSFGPDIRGPHAPGEKVHVATVERFWRLLLAVLEDLS